MKYLEDRCPKGELKGLLKRAYEQEFGKNFLYRPKQGFAIPTKYFDNRMSSQEHILKDIWIMKEKKTLIYDIKSASI